MLEIAHFVVKTIGLAHTPLRVQILSFQHTKFLKHNCLGSRRPPTENPGSATESCYLQFYNSNIFTFIFSKETDCYVLFFIQFDTLNEKKLQFSKRHPRLTEITLILL